MYPIDAIKVRGDQTSIASQVCPLTTYVADSHADSKSLPIRCVQWHDSRHLQNSDWRGDPKLMARNVERRGWRR